MSWHKLEKAVGEDGKDGQNGDSFFKNVDQDEDNVYLTLADGSVLTLPLSSSSLFDRLQSVTYVPGYEGGKAAFVKTYDDTKGYALLDFIVKPSDAVADLDSCWNDLLRFRCVETSTKSVNFIDLEIESYESDKEEGSFTIKVSGKNLSDEFFKGRQSYSAALFMTDGDNDVTSSFFDLIAVEADERPNMGLSVPFLSWGEDMGKVKDYMSDFELNYSDKMTLVYNGIKSEHLISYEFEDDKLVAAAMFVKEDMSDIDEILTLLEGYDVLHEYDGTYGEYASSESNTYAEVCKSEKSGETYWFIGWSEYVVDMGSNTITYLSSDNKAISVNTLDGFGSDLVANQFDKSTNIGTLVFSGPVTSIPDVAFSGASTLKSINLPEGIRKIGMKAFANTGLTSIKIPGSIESIGSGAFIGCSSLTRVLASDIESWCNIKFVDKDANPLKFAGKLYIDDELVTDVVIPSSVSVIKDYTFYGAKFLKNITIPDSVVSIGNYAFYNCSGLTSITIPDSVVSIGNYALSYCSGLTSITIPDSVVSIGDFAFMGCDNLNVVKIEDLSAWCNIDFTPSYGNPLYFADELYINNELVTEVVIPSSVSVIKDCTFYGAKFLKNITIPDSVVSIGDYAFRDCSGLTSITIPDSVVSIGNYAFYKCTGLTSVTISDSVVSIGDYALSYCSGLTSITIPDSVVSIGISAFAECSGLTSITIPDSVVSIGNYAFKYCYNVSDVRIGSGVETIGDSAFYGCLKYSGCMYIKAVNPPTIGDTLCYTYKTIYVPQSSVSRYKSSWSFYADWIKGYDF